MIPTQDALRLQNDRTIDHASVQLGGAWGGSISGQHAVSPVNGFGAGMHRAVNGPHLSRVDAKFRAKAVAAGEYPVAKQSGLVVQLRCYTGNRRRKIGQP